MLPLQQVINSGGVGLITMAVQRRKRMMLAETMGEEIKKGGTKVQKYLVVFTHSPGHSFLAITTMVYFME